MTESHPIPSQTIKTSSTTDSMVDAINSTMTDTSSMRSESESVIFTQPMLSINDPLRILATSQLLETTTVTESQFMKSSTELKVSTITDAPSTVATTNGSTFTMTIESPIVTPSQTGTAKLATSIDLVTNDVPQPTQGLLISIEPITTNYSPSRESPSITDTHTTTTAAIKVSSIIRSNQLQSSDQDTVTISVPIMSSMTTKSKTHTQSMLSITPTEMLTIISSEFATDSNFIGTQIIQSSGLEATIGVVTPSVTMDVPEPTAMAPSDSITESSTIPTPLKSMTVPEFETTINPLAITGSSKVRATESHPAQPQMTMVSTSSEGYQSSTSTFTVSPPPALAVAISPTPSKIATNPSANVSLSENLAATTKSMNPMEILAANSQFATVANFTEIQIIVQSSGSEATITTKAISATELAPSMTLNFPPGASQTSKEYFNILDSVPPTTTPTTLGIQATTNENSRLSYTANSMFRSLATSTANSSMATKSLRMSSSLSVTLGSSDTQGLSVPLVLSTSEYSPTTKTTGVSLNPLISESSITSPPQTISSMITASATTGELNSIIRILKSTPAAEFNATTRYGTVAESLIVSDSSIDTKSLEILPTSMAHSSSRSIFTAVSPSMTIPPSVTKKTIISMEPTPSAIDMQPNSVSSINLATTKSMTTNSEESFSSMISANETQFPQSSVEEASIITKSMSTTESHVVTPSVTLDFPPTHVVTSSLTSTANPSASDSMFLPTASTTASVIQVTASESSIILVTPVVTESERTVEASHATVTTLLLLPSITESPASSEPKATTLVEIFTSSAMANKISATPKTITTTVESLTTSKRERIPSLLSSLLIITASPNPDTATESQISMVFSTTKEIQMPTSRFFTSSNVVETATTAESQIIAMEATVTTNMATKSLSLSLLPSVTLQPSVEPSMLPSQGMTTLKPLSDIAASPAIATMTVHTSATYTGLKSAAMQTTIELSNTIESTLVVPTMLPESTETLLPTIATSEQLLSLTIVTTTDSIRFEVESSTIPGLLVTYTASLNDTATTTVGPNVRLIESSSLLSSRYPESRDVTSPLTESQTATFKLPTVHQSMAVLLQSRESVLITQSAIQTVNPLVTLKSPTDSSVSSTLIEDTEYPISLTSTFPTQATKFSTASESAVSEISATALRSIIDSESTAILTQTIVTTSHPSRFITVGSASILKPLPTMTKSVSNSPQHSTAATLVTIAESLRTASSTAPFPATLVLNPTATESVMQQTRTVTKSHISESPISLESMSNLIAVTMSNSITVMKTLSTVQQKSKGKAMTFSLLTDSKAPTITVTKSLLTIGYSSMKEYSLQTPEPLGSMEVTSYPITATNPHTVTPSGNMKPRISTEAPISTLKPTSISESMRSSKVIRITNSIKPTPQHTDIPNFTMTSSLSTSESSLSVSLSPSKCS